MRIRRDEGEKERRKKIREGRRERWGNESYSLNKMSTGERRSEEFRRQPFYTDLVQNHCGH